MKARETRAKTKINEKSETVIVSVKKGNAFGEKDCQIMNFQRKELHEWAQNHRKCITETSADSRISAKRP